MKNEPRTFKFSLAGMADANPGFGSNGGVALGKLLNCWEYQFPSKMWGSYVYLTDALWSITE